MTKNKNEEGFGWIGFGDRGRGLGRGVCYGL
jgi:hypothetical protein